MKTRSIIEFAAFVALGACSAPPILLAADDPVISYLFIDRNVDPQKIQIMGSHFSVPSTVELGTLELNVTDATPGCCLLIFQLGC